MSLTLLRKVINDTNQLALISLKESEALLKVLRHEGLLARFGPSFLNVLEKADNEPVRNYLTVHINNAITVAQQQEQTVHNECNELNKILNQVGIKPIYLKGAAYTLKNNHTSKGRTFSDIDLLVEKKLIPKAEQVLSIHGWIGKELNDYDEKYYREWAHEIPPLKHSGRGTVLDLHHNIVPLISGRAPSFEVFKNNLEEESGCFTLSPAAMTLHSAIHLFLNEDFTKGFRDNIDLHLLFSEYGEDKFWVDFVSLAKKTNFECEALLAIRYCQRNWQTNIPKDVESSFKKPSRLKIWYWDFIFSGALNPKHPDFSPNFAKTKIFFAYIRGHFLKMPSIVLVKHLVIKGSMQLLESLLGNSIFKKPPQVNR